MLWLHHRRAEEDGRVADTMQDSHGRPAIYGSVLDRGLRHFGRDGVGSISGECTRDEESAGAEDGRAGEPVVDETAHLRLIAKFVSPVAGDSHPADLLATAPGLGTQYGSSYSADAEGTDADEYPVGQRDQRSQRSDRAGHAESNCEWGTLFRTIPATIFTIANTGAMLSDGQKRSKDIAALAVELGCARILVLNDHRNHVGL